MDVQTNHNHRKVLLLECLPLSMINCKPTLIKDKNLSISHLRQEIKWIISLSTTKIKQTVFKFLCYVDYGMSESF